MKWNFSSFWKLGQVCSNCFPGLASLMSVCLLLPLGLCAQNISVDATFLPDSHADSDTTLILSGSSTVTGQTLHLIYAYENLDIDPESPFSLNFTNPEVCPTSACDAEVWVDESLDELHVQLTRTGGFTPFLSG